MREIKVPVISRSVSKRTSKKTVSLLQNKKKEEQFVFLEKKL